MYEYDGIEIDENLKREIMERFLEKYVDEDYPERILLCNHLRIKDRTIPICDLRTLSGCFHDELFLYHERMKKLFRTSFENVCNYVEQLEPWEDVDLLVFDDSALWYFCVTHNDTIVVYGLS